jgi:hypothetical protein
MRVLSAADLLTLIERGAGLSPTSTALATLACAAAGESAAGLADLPLGTRDRLLLELREQSPGGPLEALVACPHCAAELELALEPAALRVEAPASAAGTLRHGSLELRFRLPTSADLLSLEDCVDESEAVRRLAARCVESATRDGVALDSAALDAELDAGALEALGEAMAAADPQADLRLELTCAACDRRFESELDLAAFIGAELAAAARRLFGEIHVLARGYGWSEADILAMSAWRRRAYAGMLAG